jgi:hypothetical protein
MGVHYIDENNAERQRLTGLMANLTEENLQRRLPNGLSIADALAHLAFWDAYAAAMLEKWMLTGFHPPSEDWQVINQVVEGMARTIPFAALLLWVSDSALASDRAAEAVTQLAAAIEAGGKANFLCRFLHRRHHLDSIDALLRPSC